MKLRFMLPTDYDNLIGLWNRAKFPYKPQGRDSRENIEKQLKRDDLFFYVIEDNDRLVASVIVSHNGRKGWINRLAVDPQYRGQGLALQLIEYAENLLKEEGIGIFACLIEDWNYTSEKLFTSVGYQKHEDIIYYTKRIDSSV
jgi:ribosomal protein S18 acetylase RimI-like enzyme